MGDVQRQERSPQGPEGLIWSEAKKKKKKNPNQVLGWPGL